MAKVLRFFSTLFAGESWPSHGRYRSDFLVAQPTFMSGVSRSLDVMASFDAYNASATDTEADRRALECDWRVIGQDLRSVLDAEALRHQTTTPATH